MNNNLITYEQDNKDFANYLLNTYFFSQFKKGHKKLEVFLTGICKANCDYCYLKKNQKYLFPKELHNNDLIINNLQILMDWYVENEFCCPIDVFSAEWLTTPIADRVIDCFYNTFSKVPQNKRPPVIIAADNMQFVKDDVATEKVQSYIDKLKSLGIVFALSASVDGKYCDYGRTDNDDEYYQKLNQFMLKNNIKFHPMVSADNVKYQIDNFMWFKETFDPQVVAELMMLEVRNGDWTDESIYELLRFCDFVVDYKFNNEFNQDKKRFLKYVLDIRDEEVGPEHDVSYNNISLHTSNIFYATDSMNCSHYGTLCVRVADLTVAPCHRLYYPELKIGEFQLSEDNKIIGFNPNNVELLVLGCTTKRSCLPHCEKCKFQDLCVGFCQGASYEAYKNLLVPQIQVCKMYRAKISFLIKKFDSMGLFEYLDVLDHQSLSPERKRYLKDVIKSVLENQEGFCHECNQ